MRIIQSAKNLWSDNRGVTAVEYGIIASLVAAGLVIAVGTLTTGLKTAFTNIVASF